MMQCCKCKEKKSLQSFNFKNKTKGIRHKACKDCTRKEVRKHYAKNKEYYLLKARKRNIEIREKTKKFIWKYLLEHPCIDCGEKDPIVLEFDHQRDKIKAVSEIIKHNYPLETIKKEISKCVVRCANCHRKKTAIDYNWYKNIHTRL